MKNLRRMLCLFLVVLMLSTSALAVVVPGGGTNVVSGKGGAGTSFSLKYYSGIALGIQQLSGSDYTITADKDPSKAPLQTKGLANSALHFAYSYPQPYVGSSGQGLLYILPNTGTAPKYATATGGGVGQADMQCWFYADSGSLNHTLADMIYQKATANVRDENPNPNLQPNYFSGLVSKLDGGAAKQLINYIFGPRSGNYVDPSTIVSRFDQAYRQGVTGSNESKDKTRYICNYAAILLSLARLLPSENWSVYEKYVSNFVVNAFSGSSYDPVFITAELCMPFEHNGNGTYNTWRTVPEQIAIQTGVDENKVRNADVSLPSSKSIIETDSSLLNPAAAILKASYSETGQANAGKLGGTGILGLTVYGTENLVAGAHCRNMTSVADTMLQCLSGKWGKSVPGVGVWGCGVFGIDDNLTPIPAAPPTPAKIAAMGSVGILVEEKKYQKGVGDYGQTFSVTVTVNLGSDFAEGGDDVTDFKESQGAGIANTLRWLQSRRESGQSIPNPYITVWLAQAEAVEALSSDKSSYIIDETYGYFGNGAEITPNFDGRKVSSDQIEASQGSPFSWTLLPPGTLIAKNPGIEGVSFSTDNGGLKIEITDLKAAATYFDNHSDTIVLTAEISGNGDLPEETSKNQHWFKVGAKVGMYGPVSLEDMEHTTEINVGLYCIPKYDYSTITAFPEEDPYYYSRYTPPYSEFKQGTVPSSGGGSSEQFNSMTGTPTFTDTGTRVDFEDTPYENAGRYYQYFASGGSEFVVQFDGKYVESANATRTYSASYTNVTCDHNWDACQAPHTHGSKPPVPCSTCHQTYHCAHNQHQVGDTYTWSQSVTGFSYVQITNLKVWKLSEARLDGTRELLDTSKVTATVQSVAPSVSYNIASSNTASAGRLVYSYEPKQCDSVTIPGTPKASSNVCATHTTDNADDLEGKIAGKTVNAICISDFIVLRTSNGDQSILYYEYKSKNEPEVGIRTGNSFYAKPIEFDKVPYNTIWKGNSQTSAGCGLPEDGITYGGYNGNYSSMNTKYKSSGHPSNINFDTTTAYKNPSGVFHPTQKPTQKFRLLNDTLVIPDYKQNGEYVIGESYVFYEKVVNFGTEQPNFPIVRQADFGNKEGFVVHTTYSPGHGKINDVVVYNPVSNQNAIVVSLPKERDQRISTHIATSVEKATTCPGDASCPYLKNVCTITNHIHTEACYQQISFPVHTGNNQHVHNSTCPYHMVSLGGTWYHNTSGCTYAYEKHYTTSTSYCTTCGHSCGYYLGGGAGGGYLCDGKACMSSGSHNSSRCPYGHSCSGCSTCHTCENEGLYQPAQQEKVYDCNNLPLNTHVCTSQCYTLYKALLSCSDPHHADSFNWKLYTYGLRHTSGNVCSGRSCSDSTPIVFPTQRQYTVSQCASGYIVRHTNGNTHLSTTTGVCSFCDSTYKELLGSAESGDRVPAPSEYECYAYGDARCWAPCGNDANHQKVVTEVVDNGTTYTMGDFINLDWPFTIYFPNTGDFYGTGAEWSSQTSPERGHGYSNGMDATEWTKSKWVEFPFAVVYNNQTFLAHERIYLNVPETIFEFYVPLHDNEMANAEVKFGSVAINTQNGEVLECGANRDHNIENISYAGKPMAHHHNADKRTYIDVVGRIGNLALNDTGDFRFSNFFKQATSGWIVDNIVHKVDHTKQNNILLDKVDVRRVPVGETGVAGNTHNTRPERGDLTKIYNFPLTSSMNNIAALQRQPIRVGYDSYFDLTTLGNYYGNSTYNDAGEIAGQNLVLIKPHYYRLDLDSGNYSPVDVYMDVNGNKVLINDNDSNTVAYNGSDSMVNLNWVEEQARRNYSGSEVTNSNAVANANNWVQLPTGSSWVYGNYNILNLTQRNRTFVGSEYTYSDSDGWVAHKDPSDRLPNTLASLQGARWHFNVGLPSSSVFVYSGQEASQANIDVCKSGNAVIFCALEIYAQGEVWTLAYDGSNVNKPFTVEPGGRTYDPVIPYPAGKSPKGEEMPIVEIISINHSSKEDLTTAGTN